MYKILPTLLLSCLIVSGGFSSVASADEQTPAEKCFPAKDFRKLTTRIDKIDPKYRTAVNPALSMQFTVQEGDRLPERFFIRSNAQEFDFRIQADGTVANPQLLSKAGKKDKICIHPAQSEGKSEERSASFEMDVDVNYIPRDIYDLTTLQTGLKEGRKSYKTIFGPPLSLMIPKLTHVIIEYDADDTPLQASATKDGMPIEGLQSEFFMDGYFIDVNALEALGADGLRIEGGAHSVSPAASIEKMKKMGFGEDEDSDQ